MLIDLHHHVPYNGYRRLLSELDVPQTTQDAIFGGAAAKLLALQGAQRPSQ